MPPAEPGQGGDQGFPSVVSGALGRPFDRQVAFFRDKLGNLVPTRRWTDMMREAHDTGFMVAGAAKADLLADLAAAVDRAIAEGTSLEAFRKDFRHIVARRGWHDFTGAGSEAGVAWRTRVIYATNAQTSYAAGREAQLREGGFTLWVYRHNDSVTHPRPQHLAWDGLTLPPDHPFWRTHSPPNGWGCRCYKLGARSEAGARRLGGDPSKSPPEGWDGRDPATGAPPGIDRGWDYAPGRSVAANVQAMAPKVVDWDHQLAVAFLRGAPPDVRDALSRAYRQLPSVADDMRRYAERVVGTRNGAAIADTVVEPRRTLALVTADQASELARRVPGLDVARFQYSVDASAVRHVFLHHGDDAAERLRGQRAVTAADFARLPAVLDAPDDVDDGGTDDKGRRSVIFTRRLGGETYVVVLQARRNRRALALVTMFVRPR